MSFPRYPKYKPSGVEWLGDVPEHWDVWKLAHAFSLIASGTTPKTDTREYYDDGDIPWINTGDLNDGELEDCGKRITARALADHSSLKLYPSGSLLIAMYGATIGKLAMLRFPATVNQACCVFAGASPIVSKFMFYWFLGLRQQILSLATGGGQPNVSQDILRTLRVGCPDYDEQTKIASFLDRETSKIDALVGEQRRLIELLKEKRQAVISHAVTKGLNPHAPLKPSGIEWLGDVPEHWEVKPMRMIANVVRGASPRPAGDPLYFGGDAVPWVTVAEITKDNLVDLTETETFLTEEGARNSKLFLKGTVIYSNSGATLGVPKILRIDACANDGVVAFEQLSREVHPQFLYHYLASITDAIREKVKQGSGQPNLNTDIVKALRFGLPPMDEQERIVGHIAELTDQFHALTAEAERGIELLQERRTALISAAVTGQIDVRGLVTS